MIRTLIEIQGGRVNVQETHEETTVTVTIDGALSNPAELAEAAVRYERERLYTAAEVGDLQAGEAELVAAPLRRRVAALTADLDSHKRTVRQVNEMLDESRDKLVKRDEQVTALVARIRELEADRNRWRGTTTDATNTLDFCQGELAEARQKRDMFKAQAYSENERAATLKIMADTERERADQNKEWAERTEARVIELERALAEADVKKDRDDRMITVLEGQVAARDRELEAERNRLADQVRKVSGAVHGPEILVGLRTTWSTPESRALAEAVREVRRIIGSPGVGTDPA